MADVNLNFKINFGGGDPAAPVKEVTAQVKGLEGALASLKTSAGDIFKGAFGAALATKALDALSGAVSSAVGFISDSIAEAQQAEKAQAALAFAIADTSKNVAKSVTELSKFADELSIATAVEDDAIVSSTALLAQLTKLDEQGLKKATTAAVDLSAALGISLEDATQRIAKAANGNVTAFQKLGFEIKKGNTDAETFANTLTALASQQGAAAAKAQTFSGAIAFVENSFKNVKEAIGKVFTDSQVLVNIFAEASKIFVEFKDSISNSSSTLTSDLGAAIVTVIDVLAKLSVAFEVAYKYASLQINSVLVVFNGLFAAIFKGLSYLSPKFDEAFNFFSEAATKSAESVRNVFNGSDTPLTGVTNTLIRLKDAAEQGLGQIAKSAKDTQKPLGDSKKAVQELTEAQKKLGEEGAKLIESNLKKALPGDELAKQQEAIQAAVEQGKKTALEGLIAQEEVQAEFDAKRVEALLAQNESLATINLEANAAEIAANKAKIDAIIAQETLGSQQRLKLEADAKKQRDALKKQEEDAQKARLQAFAGFFGNLATLQQTGSQELFAIGKAAAIAQATIDGYLAVQGAYTKGTEIGGPVLGAIFASAAAIASGVNLAKISATHLASGIDSVPAGFQNDNFPALLQTGERVVPAKTNEDLTAFLATRNNDTALLAEISAKLDRLSPNVSVQIGEKEVFGVIRDGLNAGRAFA